MTAFYSRLVAAVAWLALTASAALAQDCAARLELTQGASFIQRGFNPYQASAASQEFFADVVSEGDACEILVQADLRAERFGLSGPSGNVRYRLLERNFGADLTPETSRSGIGVDPLRIQIQPGGRVQLRFVLQFEPSELELAGEHVQTIDLTLLDAAGLVLERQAVRIGVEVERAATLSLAGVLARNPRSALIDLGELSTGLRSDPGQLALLVQATSPYEISATSRNGAALKLEGGEWAIGYDLLINGASALRSGQAFQSPARKGRFADRFPVQAVVGEVGEARAGLYSDIVTLRIEPR